MRATQRTPAGHDRTTTTVRMRLGTRERLTQLAEQLGGRTVDETVAAALDLLERDLFWRQVKEAHAAVTPEELAADAAEMQPWDRAASRDFIRAETVGDR